MSRSMGDVLIRDDHRLNVFRTASQSGQELFNIRFPAESSLGKLCRFLAAEHRLVAPEIGPEPIAAARNDTHVIQPALDERKTCAALVGKDAISVRYIV